MITKLDNVDVAWTMFCSSLIFLMVPGVTFLYGAGVQTKNRLYIMIISIICMAIAYLEFYFFGYSLAFDGQWGTRVIGGFDKGMLLHLGSTNSKESTEGAEGNEGDWVVGKEFLNFLINLSGVGIATCLIVGGSAERSTTKSILAYVLLWMPLVYCPLIYITVNDDGFMTRLGYFNYTAGITNLAIGVSSLCFSYMLGPRLTTDKKERDLANRTTFSYLGTFLVWFTWFGLVGSGTGGANLRTVIALINMNISGVTAGLTQMLLGKYINNINPMKPSQFCTGLVAGLLAVSPAAGLIPIYYSLIFGLMGGFFCVLGTKLKHYLKIDEPTGIFETHGMASLIGMFLTGIFTTERIARINGGVGNSGFVDGNWAQPWIQLLGAVVAIVWGSIASLVLCMILILLPWFGFRINARQEEQGMDLGEMSMEHDTTRDLEHHTQSKELH